ncbi:hypothetical protein BGZ72_004719 [Mortierella alpina]|nr:hypothetical protein BGZ72_004719 [Mortierella alpina]
MLVVALAYDARCTAASQSTPQVHAEERTMWRRGFRPALLPTRTLHSRILPCCHHCSRTTRTAWTVMDDPRSQSIRHAWNWSKIKPDPKKPFFAQRSTRNTPHTAVVLLRNADIPMLQIKPPVFLPATAEQVQHSLNILLFMSDFNIEPRPLAVNALTCSSTGQIYYIQIANQHLSLLLPTYKITNGGSNPERIPTLLKTFLESSAYSKIGFGAYEDAMRVKDQYGITCKNILDIHWMAKVLGIGSTNVGMLHSVFGEIHDVYIPGSIQHHHQPDDRPAIPAQQQSRAFEQGQLIDPRHWDWESHGDIELSKELIRCIAQDAFATLGMYDNIQAGKFRQGYQSLLKDPQKTAALAKDFLLQSVPRGAPLPIRSIHHLVKGPFMSPDVDSVVRDAQALALVKLLIENQSLVPDQAESTSLSFQDPSVLSRRVSLPGIRSSEAILANHQTRKIITEAFGCRLDELRLLQDADLSRKPDKIQDLECFLGLYEWLEFLPGAELDETKEQLHHRSSGATEVTEPCGRKEPTLLALYMNFGSIAARAKDRPSETREWARTRVERLVKQGALIRTGGPQGVIRVNPALICQLKRIDRKGVNRPRLEEYTENKILMAR